MLRNTYGVAASSETDVSCGYGYRSQPTRELARDAVESSIQRSAPRMGGPQGHEGLLNIIQKGAVYPGSGLIVALKILTG